MMKIHESDKIEQDLQKFGQALQCTLATKLKGWDNIHALAREIRDMDGIDVDSKCIELGFGSFAELLLSPKMAKFVVAINQQWPAPVVYKAKVDEATRGVMEMQREFEVYRQKKEQRREKRLEATPSTALTSLLNHKSREKMYQRPILNSDEEQKVNSKMLDKSQIWPIVTQTPSGIMRKIEAEKKRWDEEWKKLEDERKRKEFGNDPQLASRRVTFSSPASPANSSRLDNKALSYLQTPTIVVLLLILVLLLIAIALLLTSNKKDSINMNNQMPNEQMLEDLKRKLVAEIKRREEVEGQLKAEEEKKRKEKAEKRKKEEEGVELELGWKLFCLGFVCAVFFGLCISDQVALSFIVGFIFGCSFVFTSFYGFSSLFSLLFSFFLGGFIGLLFLGWLKKILKRNKRKERNDFKTSSRYRSH